MKFVLFLFLLVPLFAQALEVDEKLTVRVVRTSESRKTIMINRGTEDGLVEGDHARFIVTAGIVARAVCVKISPTRSVWSVYRLVNADFVVNDAVMTIKITPAVKITKDESQQIVQEDVPTKAATDPSALGIPLADGAQDISSEADLRDEADLRSAEITTIVERNWEVYTNFNVSGLSSTTKQDTGTSTFKNSFASHHIGVGVEYYPQNERSWYSRFSLMGSVDLMRLNSQSYSGEATTNDVTEFSFGANWHPGSMPSSVLTFIPFVHLSAQFGSVNSSFKHGSDNATAKDFTANGGTSGLSLGFGYKFYTSKGFGFRALLDYYTDTQHFSRDDEITKRQFNRVVSGPRFMFGISYRW
jgi:hypothetical protein